MTPMKSDLAEAIQSLREELKQSGDSRVSVYRTNLAVVLDYLDIELEASELQQHTKAAYDRVWKRFTPPPPPPDREG